MARSAVDISQRLLEDPRKVPGLLFVELRECHDGCTFAEARAVLRSLSATSRSMPNLPKELPWRMKFDLDGTMAFIIRVPGIEPKLAKIRVDTLRLPRESVPIRIRAFKGECSTLAILALHMPRIRIPHGTEKYEGLVSAVLL